MAAAWSETSNPAKYKLSRKRHTQTLKQMNTKQRKRLADGTKERERLELYAHSDSQRKHSHFKDGVAVACLLIVTCIEQRGRQRSDDFNFLLFSK